MTTETKTAEAAPTSSEDKFFGQTTTIDEMLPAKKEKEPEITVEISEEPATEVAATPEGASKEDLTGYSDKVQKRIDKLTWEKNEEKRLRAATEAERDEAFRVAGLLNNRTQEQERIITSGEAHLVQTIKSRAELAVNSANANYTAAYESGDSAAIIKAQQEMINAQSEAKEAGRYIADYNRRTQPQPQQQQRQYQQPQYVPQQQQQTDGPSRSS